MAAGNAEFTLAVTVHQPVADVEAGIGAEADVAIGIGNELPERLVARLQRMHRQIAWQEAEAMVATHASTVVEVDDLIAIVAGKKLHLVYLCKA
jgi:hypothetical protein